MQVSCVAQGKRAGRKKTMHQPLETFLPGFELHREPRRSWPPFAQRQLNLCCSVTHWGSLPCLFCRKPTDAPTFLLRGAHSIEWKSGRRWINNSAVLRPLPICLSAWIMGEYFSPSVQRLLSVFSTFLWKSKSYTRDTWWMQWLSLPYSFQGKQILTCCCARWASTGITWCPRADVIALPFCTTMEKIQPTDWVWRSPWQVSSVGCLQAADTAGALKEAEETSF